MVGGEEKGKRILNDDYSVSDWRDRARNWGSVHRVLQIDVRMHTQGGGVHAPHTYLCRNLAKWEF